MDKLSILLTSSVIAAILSALISLFVSFRLKQVEFKNEYYKQIISKRLAAYQYLERQIADLKLTLLDEEDRKPYHMIFARGKEKFIEYQFNLSTAFTHSLWIDKNTLEAMDKLNDLFFHILTKIEFEDDIIKLGKKHYLELAKVRDTLEGEVRNDLFNLHKLEKFFQNKTHGGLRPIYKRND